MNANGDERIDHDEFVKFFLKMLMGSFEQKMLIAFKCYDVDDDQSISKTEVEVIMKNIPVQISELSQNHCEHKENHVSVSKSDYMDEKRLDSDQIDDFIEVLFSGFEDEEIYFDEFVKLAKEVTSELFVCVYDCIYRYIPCVKNFLIMRANYLEFLQSRQA